MSITSNTSDIDSSTLPSGWTTPAGGGLNLVTTYQVDTLGRTTKETSPSGNANYTVYKDGLDSSTGFENEVRVYPGWHAVSGGYTTTGPVQVSRDNLPNSFSETLTYDPGTITSSTPDGTGILRANGVLYQIGQNRNGVG